MLLYLVGELPVRMAASDLEGMLEPLDPKMI